MSIFIREATLADAPLLAALHATSFEEAWDEKSFRGLLGRPGCFALLAREGENSADAFILVQLASSEAEIQSLGTAPDARRKGHAAHLVAAAAKEALRRGAAELFLEVANDNPAALALYARAGFRLVGSRPGYYPRSKGPPSDAAILRAILPLRQS